MPELYRPHAYQAFGTAHILSNPACALFYDMGLGKTVSTLSALVELLFDRLEARKVLVVAPKRVAVHTWPAEVEKWQHTARLRLSVIDGTAEQRAAALEAKADIFTIGRDNLAWLVAHVTPRKWPFDVIVLDELSSFKNHKSKRFKALRKVRPYCKRVIGLTGTPAPNSLIDLWAQLYLLDRGERLGRHLGNYQRDYFTRGKGNGYVVYDWNLQPGAEAKIHALVGDLCISMRAADHLKTAGRTDQIVRVPLGAAMLNQYNEFKAERLLELAELEVITAANAAVLVGKLLQFCNGAVYIETDGGPKVWREVHNEKIEAVRDDLEALNGEPMLLFYQFRHDLERLTQQLAEYNPRELRTPADINDWNAGKVPFMLAHAASTGHGLNLQHGGHYLGWFGVPWNLELYQQATARLDRQGQKHHVINRRYLVPGSVEFDVLRRLESKDATQASLLNAVRAMLAEFKALR